MKFSSPDPTRELSDVLSKNKVLQFALVCLLLLLTACGSMSKSKGLVGKEEINTIELKEKNNEDKLVRKLLEITRLCLVDINVLEQELYYISITGQSREIYEEVYNAIRSRQKEFTKEFVANDEGLSQSGWEELRKRSEVIKNLILETVWEYKRNNMLLEFKDKRLFRRALYRLENQIMEATELERIFQLEVDAERKEESVPEERSPRKKQRTNLQSESRHV